MGTMARFPSNMFVLDAPAGPSQNANHTRLLACGALRPGVHWAFKLWPCHCACAFTPKSVFLSKFLMKSVTQPRCSLCLCVRGGCRILFSQGLRCVSRIFPPFPAVSRAPLGARVCLQFSGNTGVTRRCCTFREEIRFPQFPAISRDFRCFSGQPIPSRGPLDRKWDRNEMRFVLPMFYI